jgi:hypothetical protein
VNQSPAIYEVPPEFWNPRFTLWAFLNDRQLMVVAGVAFIGFQLFNLPGLFGGALLGYALAFERHDVPQWRRGLLYAAYLVRDMTGQTVVEPSSEVALSSDEEVEARQVVLRDEDGRVLVYLTED